ncbi:MAG: HAD family hydrolase [Rhodospirillaceae bacterium]|jgi:HAD superfamily hydrolase (TIGR01509 family)|nr:HAD family hydrolase [Rhodospirillaceae bacterium]MBT5895097.1 HAD family hydrolase [Rhodospirillaceae bacterium]MBT7664628.1 HAD family hydrolase [Rhodospirillaceae bacterium]MBT7756938.1 HAD family hydrolase [Rhodospirillaceae bacterium]
MPFELVIFDCDGVLVDSEPLANRVLSRCFQDAGFPITYDTCVATMVGLSLPSCFKMAEDWHGKALPDDFFHTVQSRTYQAIRDELQAIPGVRAAIEAIPLPRCVASSSEPEKIALSLTTTGLAPLFEGRLYSASQVARGKPFPDLFFHAAAQMGIEPGNCVVVEDSPYGAAAARAAGMAVLGYTGSGFADKLTDEGAEIFDTMADLPGLLGFPP